ncbi:MAG: ATP-dependent DNA helicase RecG [Clostridiales bacterium]|nr:ATP-dependent DNA helicase RecG [Clostridiales bacterium]
MLLSDIKGIKSKRLEILNNSGIYTPVDLISFFPKRYIDLNRLSDLRKAKEGEDVLILARTEEDVKVSYIKKNMNVVKAKFVYDNLNVYITYFNQPYMAKNIVKGKYYYISGKLKIKNGLTISNPSLYPFTGDTTPIPVYTKLKGLPQNTLVSAIDTVLSSVRLNGYIPKTLSDKYELCEINSAYASVHHPKDMQEIAQAKRTVSVEYLNYIISVYALVREKTKTTKKRKYNADKDKFVQFIQNLPFTLTQDQGVTVKQIISDLDTKGCNRLVQGDVGCGKTAVAMCAIYYAYLSGYQSAFLAPTEVLAFQHYKTAISYLEKYGVKVAFLSGSVKKSERSVTLERIANGEVDVIVGTHALFSDDVTFRDLALVITDEQQRFGVKQRSALENKTKDADVVSMTATPIPRTLALTLYGELSVSSIKTMPKNKASIRTRFIPKEKEESMWKYIVDKANAGEQTYVVCPAIEEDEDSEIVSVKELYKKASSILGDSVGVIHGQLKEETKNRIMKQFADGNIKVLVATTVIEVGIDVKNATTMVVYNADRFGLSQLHQLRGRVGRGEIDSYCFVLSDNESVSTQERISYFCSCSDGFELSEYDFSKRGGGDFLGTAQHGGSGEFDFDASSIRTAKEISDSLLSDENYRKIIGSTVTDNRFEYFKDITLN